MAGKLNPWQQQAQNNAAPRGLNQTAEKAGQYAQNPTEPSSFLGQLAAQNGYTSQAKSWYTGANAEGEKNGWDNDFVKKFIDGQEKAAKEKRLGTYFETETATGVVTWDHTGKKDGEEVDFKFGDIYEDGKKKGNIYDEKAGGFDRATADLMMSDWLFDPKTKAKIFQGDESPERMKEEVIAKRDQNNFEIPKQMKALDFADTVEAREKQFREGAGDEAIVATGALGTGLLGAGIGSIVPVVGTTAGFIGGTIVGGVATWLNKDQLTESAARAYEITSMATQENGLTAGIFEGVHQWAGYGGKLLAPTSNLTQGLYDAQAGKVGDGTSEYYRVDEVTGQREAPGWVKAADIAASFVDAALLFGSPIGASMYTAQMGSTITGSVGSLAVSGSTFDDRQGGFDNIFTDDKGQADWGAAAAGIGSIGIDVVQLGMARGLVNRADASMKAIGGEARYGTNFATRQVDKAKDRLPTWAGGRTDEAKAVLKAGGSETELVGHKFLLDAEGKAVGARRSLSLLAPSELLPAISSKAIARRSAAYKDKGAIDFNDFYRAANSMAVGERKMTGALVNAIGEGSEEAIQAVLEPLSHNSSAELGDIFESFLYGAAMGGGMTLATSLNSSSADEKMYAVANINRYIRTGGEQMPKEEWRAMNPTERRLAAAQSEVEGTMTKAVFERIVEDMETNTFAGVAGANKLVDAIEGEKTKGLKRLTDRTDAALVVTQIEDTGRLDADGNIDPNDWETMPTHAVGASGKQTLANILNHLNGVSIQVKSLTNDLAARTEELLADPENLELQEQIKTLDAQITLAKATQDVGRDVLEDLQTQINRLYDPSATLATKQADTALINRGLRMLFNEEDPSGQLDPRVKRAMARSISILSGRDPWDSTGSFQMLVPQVSLQLTMDGADEMLQISQAILPSIRGDFDGDKMRPLNQLILDDAKYENLRTGIQFLGAVNTKADKDGNLENTATYVNIGTPKYEAVQMTALSEAHLSANTTMQQLVAGTLTDIAAQIRSRYTGIDINGRPKSSVNAGVLDALFTQFFAAAKSGDKDARAVLLDGLALKQSEQITAFSRNNLSNEWLWIDHIIRSNMQLFQENYSRHRPDVGPVPDISDVASPKKMEKKVRERAIAAAAVYGQTMGNLLPGDSPFRQFQKLHYTSGEALVVSADTTQGRSALRKMAQFYEMLGQDHTQAELDALRAKDSITARALANLQILARDFTALNPQMDPNQALAVVANMKVQNFEVDSDGMASADGTFISVAQLLLKQSLMKDRRDKDAIFETSPELQAKHRRIAEMTRPGGRGNSNSASAERAFIEIVGSQQLVNILGSDAVIFGAHLTVEQFVRGYSDQGEVGRKRHAKQLRREAAYLGKKQPKDMPYDMKDMEDVSPYRAMVDAMVAVGNSRISMTTNSAGEVKLTGELAKKSNRVSKTWRKNHENIRTALFEYAKLSPRQDGELTVDLIQRMVENDPQFARDLMELIPDVSAAAMMEVRGEEVFIANWFFKTWAIKDPAEAEMHYWRNTWRAGFMASKATSDKAAADEGESIRRFDRLPRRLDRIAYRLDSLNDGGLLKGEFLKQMDQATSVDDFMEWVNTTPGIRGDQAPLTAWADDVADFDMDKAQGGWSTNLQGAEQREAITTLKESSRRLVRSLVQEKEAWIADAPVMNTLRKVEAYNAGDTSLKVSQEEIEVHKSMVAAIKESGERYIGLGPQAMIYQSMAALLGFYPQAHTKGVNPPAFQLAGAMDAQRDAFDYTTNYERVQAALTSVNLKALGNAPAQLAKDNTRTMDEFGRAVEWTTPTVSDMLDLLENVETRALARSILFPQVMERTSANTLSTQLLSGRSLTDLLSGAHLDKMFPADEFLDTNSALLYMSALEAEARRFGGHTVIQRAVNDIVIMNTSGAFSELKPFEQERLVVEAYTEAARLFQATGSIDSVSNTTGPLIDPMLDLYNRAREAARTKSTASRLGVKNGKDSEATSDELIKFFLDNRDTEFKQEQLARTNLINELLKTDPAAAEEIEAEFEAAARDHEEFKLRVGLMQSNDEVAMVVEMFSIPADPVAAVAKQQALTDYVMTHRGITKRVTSQALVFRKMTNQLRDSGRQGMAPSMTDKEWKVIQDSVIADFLVNASSRAANFVSIQPYPDPTSPEAKNARYYDRTFSYVLEPFMTEGPALQAARSLHARAGRIGEVASDETVLDIIGKGILKDFSSGRWTQDILRSSVAANGRLDAAASAPGIAIPGNGPKRQAALSAAMRRTFELPDAATMSSTLKLISRDLRLPADRTVDILMPDGATAKKMPLAQLNGRFASSVIATLPDGTVVDMLQTTNVGLASQINPLVRDSGFKAITVDRMLDAVQDLGVTRKVDPEKIVVEVKFFHPDSQPVTVEKLPDGKPGPNWHNNIYFEGLVFATDGDVYQSLNSALWFARGGISPEAQATALDASKLGLPAINVIPMPTSEEIIALEAGWETDLSAMLRIKTATLMATDFGAGYLDASYYNAVYKNMKIRHWVQGTDADGNKVHLPAEDVITWQLENPGKALELTNPKLWMPTDDVLRSMLGEQGSQGVDRIFDDQLDFDLANVKTYRGLTDVIKTRFAHGIAGETAELKDTSVTSRAYQSQMTVRAKVDPATQSRYEARLKWLRAERNDIWSERGKFVGDSNGYSTRDNLGRALKVGNDALKSESLAFDWTGKILPFFGARKKLPQDLSKIVLRDLAAAMAEDEPVRTGWIYREGSNTNPLEGIISNVNLGKDIGDGRRIAPDDLVVIEVDSFGGDFELAKKRLDTLASTGAFIVLGSGDGSASLRPEMAMYLKTKGYESVAGSKHLFQAADLGSVFQNVKARTSTRMAIEGVSRRNKAMIFHVEDQGIEENGAWTVAGNPRLTTFGLSMNLVPVNAFAQYNVAVDSLQQEGPSEVEDVRQQVRGLNNKVDLQFMAEMATEKMTDKAARADAIKLFKRDFKRMVQRIDDHDGTVLPQFNDEFGTGDMIPLVGMRGELLIYRHGYKAPQNAEAIREQQSRLVEGSPDARRVAVYSAELEPAATTHTGRVVKFNPRGEFGLEVELELDFQTYGDKMQVEFSGMKYVETPMPNRIVLPKNPDGTNSTILGSWGIDLIGSWHDAISKESFDGMLDNHRTAFMAFGVDFLPDVQKFLGVGAREARAFLEQLESDAPALSIDTAGQLLDASNLGATFAEHALEFGTAMNESLGINVSWIDRLNEPTVEAQIAKAIFIYLMIPNTRVSDVLYSGGLNDESSSPKAQARLMPSIFTDFFDDAPLNSDLALEMNRRFNQQIKNQNPDGSGHILHPNWEWEVRNTDRGKSLRGIMQIAEMHSSGDNPVKNGMSFEAGAKASVSQHSAQMAYAALGVSTAAPRDLTRAREFAEATNIHRFTAEDLKDGGVWRAFKTEGADRAFAPWMADTPAESAYRELSRKAMVTFVQPIKTDIDSWTDDQRRDYTAASRKIVNALGLKSAQSGMVDGWVRQFLGMADGMNEDGQMHHISGVQALEAAEMIQDNVDNHFLPTVGAMVPLMDVMDLQMIYRASTASSRGWKPRSDASDPQSTVAEWKDWVDVSLGSALTTDDVFDPLFLAALDGFMHTYQAATSELLALPVSMDALQAENLLLPENNRLFVASLDPNTQHLVENPAHFGADGSTIDTLLKGQRIAGKYKGRSAPASAVSKRLKKHREWRAENGVPIPLDVTMSNFRKNGADFVHHGTNTNAAVRILIHLRVGTALINPALWISAGPEMMVRGTIDKMANLLTGQATTGMLAHGQARLTDALGESFANRIEAREAAVRVALNDATTDEERNTALQELEDLPMESIFQKLGLGARYSRAQQDNLQSLYGTLAQRSDFKRMIYKDLDFLRPFVPSIGKFEKATGAYAKFGTSIQDPTRGVRPETLARRYVEAVIEHIEARPTVNPIAIDTLVAEMKRNPLFLQKNYPEAHQAGVNAIAQARSLKRTIPSMMMRSFYEPLSEHNNSFINVPANIFLKLPFLFSGYAMNVITTITGMQGLNDMVAMMKDGKEKSLFVQKYQAAMKGQPLTEEEKYYDMSEVLEGVDLSRSFVRAGITHTGLMAFGLMAGGLGLTGEDEEERRRRRASQYQGAGYVYDPRKMENDFRNADAVWFGNTPFQLPWIAKQFLSPVIGLERFFDTGDLRQVMWGFQDAVGAFPIINTMMWNDAVETGQDFASMAKEAADKGDDVGLIESAGLLTSMVGSYERMLFENSFVNQIYMAADPYDRDPFAEPMKDSDGDVQRDARGEPRSTEALRLYYDDQGKIKEGYLPRSSTSAKLHQMTENRATMAGAFSIFTGLGDSSFFRRNMAIKTRSFEASTLTKDEAKAAIQSLVGTQGPDAVMNLSPEEALNFLRNTGYGGKYAKNKDLEPIANEMAAGSGFSPLSVLNKDGREELTKDGAKAVMRGLAKGTVEIGHPSLKGLHLTFEQRNELATEWMQDLVQEGIDMGLDETRAQKRMQRLWNGPYDNPSIQGIGDILYNKDIDYSDKLEYNQLNTTYVTGPDGLPWATGFARQKVMGNFLPSKQIEPDKGFNGEYSGVMSIDERYNSVDGSVSQNLGLRALERVNAAPPTDEEIGKAIEKAIEEAGKKSYTPFDPYSSSGGRSSGGYGRRGGGGYGGGGGGYAPTVYFSKMNPFPDQRAPYGDGIPFINTSNPILRRSDVRRERISSERGRLKQWQ